MCLCAEHISVYAYLIEWFFGVLAVHLALKDSFLNDKPATGFQILGV